MKQVIPNLLQPSLNCLQNNLIFSYLYGNIPCDSYIILPYQQSFGGILVLVMDTETLVPFYCIDIASPKWDNISWILRSKWKGILNVLMVQVLCRQTLMAKILKSYCSQWDPHQRAPWHLNRECGPS